MNGVEINIKDGILNITQLLYAELYQTKTEPPGEIIKTKIQNFQLEISKPEIKEALKEIKNKGLRKEGITADMLKYGGKMVMATLHSLLN